MKGSPLLTSLACLHRPVISGDDEIMVTSGSSGMAGAEAVLAVLEASRSFV